MALFRAARQKTVQILVIFLTNTDLRKISLNLFQSTQNIILRIYGWFLA